jgi:hypothetical protein
MEADSTSSQEMLSWSPAVVMASVSTPWLARESEWGSLRMVAPMSESGLAILAILLSWGSLSEEAASETGLL